jgi:hypothetical protein
MAKKSSATPNGLKFSSLFNMINAQWNAKRGNEMAYLILGEPGGGKSALARLLVKGLGGTPETTVEFTPSLRDPVDILGTPRNNGEFTQWVPPSEFYKLRYRPNDPTKYFLIVEEATDASMAMQNPMCRIVLDRHAGDLRLSDNLHIIMTGNRTEDKSGANRLSTKLGNRLNVQHFESNLDDWVNWALDQDIDPLLIQFIRFKPNLLSDFNPDSSYGINPTPRAWEKVALVPTNMSPELYYANIAGIVGEGPAAEYTGFRKVANAIISFDEVVANPEKVKIPTDLSAQYAIVGSVSHNTTVGNVDRVAKFMARMTQDFAVMYWYDTTRRLPTIKTTKPFIAWAASSSNVLSN